MVRLSTLVTLVLLFTVGSAVLFGAGCANIAADYILAFGSNGGKTPIPEELEYVPLFDEVRAVRVQDAPEVDLVVWVIEPRPIRVWVEETAADADWAKLIYQSVDDESHPVGISLATKGGPIIRVRWGQPKSAVDTNPRGTILVLQGQGGCARIHPHLWPIAAALANEGYRVILPDLRSQGDSTGKELGFIIKDGQDLRRVLDRLEREQLLVGKVGILGHSYGAAAGGYLATQDDRVVTCILSGSPMTWRGVIEFQGSQNWLWRLMTDGTRERIFQRCGERMGYDIDSLDARQFIAATDKPLLLLHGRKDTFVPIEHATEVYNTRPENTRLVVYEEASHGDYFFTHFEEVRHLCVSWFAEHLQRDAGVPPAPR